MAKAKPRPKQDSKAPPKPKTPSSTARLEQAQRKRARQKYLLRLYITGTTPRSMAAVANIRRICEEHLKGRYDLDIIDIYQQKTLAKGEQIIAAPTLIKKLPLPLRRIVGDMSNKERVLLGLDLRPGR
jgi:circadian clock protein KaiB